MPGSQQWLRRSALGIALHTALLQIDVAARTRIAGQYGNVVWTAPDKREEEANRRTAVVLVLEAIRGFMPSSLGIIRLRRATGWRTTVDSLNSVSRPRPRAPVPPHSRSANGHAG